MVIGFFGVPGCGKTTLGAMFAQKELKKINSGRSRYEKVLTNFYCEGCYKIDYVDLGHYHIKRVLVILDEMSLDADSRDFKQFDIWHKVWWLTHRHDFVDVIYLTQQYDGIDKKIRDITQNLYFVKSTRIFPLTIAKRIYRQLDINEFTKEIVQGYRFANLWDYILGTRNTIYCYRPKWYKYFDSFEETEFHKKRKDFEFKLWLSNEATPKSVENESQDLANVLKQIKRNV